MARVIRGGVVDAHEEAARIRESARLEMAAERDSLRAELAEQARAELAASYLELARARAAIELDAERAIIPLAVAIARRVIGEEIAAQPDHVRTIAREAIERVRRAGDAHVRVHPLDASVVRDLGAVVVEDASIERGGCLIESSLGEVDARIEARIDTLARALAKTT